MVSITEEGPGILRIGSQGHGPPQGADGFRVVPGFAINSADRGQGFQRLRIQLQGPLRGAHRQLQSRGGIVREVRTLGVI